MDRLPLALLLVVVAYLVGAIPFGLVLTRLVAKKDVRAVGSGNIGATNVARAAGKGMGVLVLALDAGKGFLAGWLGYRLLFDPALPGTEWAAVAVAAAAFAGHVFPVYLRFRGGKGVATALGVLFAIAPWAAVAGLGTYAAIYAATRVSSLGSISGTLVAMGVCVASGSVPVAVVAVGMTVVIVARHRENIRRLVRRQEARL